MTPKIGPVQLIQNHLQSSRKFIVQYIDHKNQVLYLFYLYQLKKSAACFHQDQKCQNRVKIVDFLTVLGITRIVIITEQWTKNLKDLVLCYEYTTKKLFKSIKKKWATDWLPIGLAMTTEEGGHTAVPQCANSISYTYQKIPLKHCFWRNCNKFIKVNNTFL